MSVLSWFFLGIGVFALAMLAVLQHGFGQAYNSRLFGVKIPSEETGSPVFQAIRKAYRRQGIRMLLAAAATCWVPVLFGRFPSLSFLYWIVWLFLFYYLAVLRPYIAANRSMAACKAESGWAALPGREPWEDDRYWKYGLFYCNPNDPSACVPGQARNGMTFNLGSRKGRAGFIALCTVITAVLIGLCAFLMPIDFSTPRFSLAHGSVVVDYPVFGTSIPLANIESVSLTTAEPDTSYHTNGAGTSQWARGTFVHDGEKMTVFIYCGRPPYIKAMLKDGSAFYFNEKAPADTRSEYAHLRQALGWTAAG